MKQYDTQELTLQGVRMHYVAGQEIRKRYSNLINARLGADELWVRSTDYNRTLQSAISHLYGMFENDQTNNIAYPKDDNRVLPPFIPTPEADMTKKTALDVPYIPYPIHTTTKDQDEFLDAWFCNKTLPGNLDGQAAIAKRITYLDSFKLPLTV